MAGRIRTLKPEILSDERTAALSDAAWRLFVSMILMADDPGNLRAQHLLLVSEVWWAHPRRDRIDMGSLLQELETAELITPYRVRGQSYAHLRGWAKHQVIDHPGRPRVPGPTEADQAPPSTTRGDEKRTVSDRFAPDPDLDLDQDPDQDPQSPARPKVGRTPAAQEDEALLTFPTVRGKRTGDTEWRFTRSAAAELREGFPDLDVLAEARMARAWILAKPERRKTSGGMMSFLVGWLGRSQNRGGARTGTPAARTPGGARSGFGPAAPSSGGLCQFHLLAENANRRARRHEATCSECRHVAAANRPAVGGPSEPVPIGALFDDEHAGGKTNGVAPAGNAK